MPGMDADWTTLRAKSLLLPGALRADIGGWGAERQGIVKDDGSESDATRASGIALTYGLGAASVADLDNLQGTHDRSRPAEQGSGRRQCVRLLGKVAGMGAPGDGLSGTRFVVGKVAGVGSEVRVIARMQRQ